MKKIKTSAAVRQRQADFEADQKRDREIFDGLTDMFQNMCNAGLVDDVEPDGPVPVEMAYWTCGMCGQDFGGNIYSDVDWYEEHLKHCPKR